MYSGILSSRGHLSSKLRGGWNIFLYGKSLCLNKNTMKASPVGAEAISPECASLLPGPPAAPQVKR